MAKFGDPTTMARACALEIATLSLFFENKKSIPLGLSEALDAHMDTKTIGASCPWNLSTLPTLASEFN